MAVPTSTPEHLRTAVDWSTKFIASVATKEQQLAGYTSKDRIKFYDSNANAYDQDLNKYGYRGPQIAAEVLHQTLNGNYGASILDVCCGTGLGGEMLLKLGPYTNMVGLDASEGMLEVARQKNIYKDFKCQYLYLGCDLEKDTYDAVVSVGSFVAGHLKSDALIEMCNAVKPGRTYTGYDVIDVNSLDIEGEHPQYVYISGGYVVVALRQEYMETVEEYKLNMRSTINKLVSEGRWKVIRDDTVPNWIYGDALPGQVFVFQKL